jgi:hypothetical protein
MAAGGVALIVSDVPSRRGEPSHLRFRQALGSAPLDLIVFSAPGPPAELQALAYAALEDPQLGAAFHAAALRYREQVEATGADGFRHCLVVLRDTAEEGATEPRLTATLPVSSLREADARVLQERFAAFEFAGMEDARLLELHVTTSPRARWVEIRDRPDASPPARSQVRFDPGALAEDLELDEVAALLCTLLARGDTVAGIAARWAELREIPIEQARGEVMDQVRRWLGTGLLVPGAERRETPP